MQFSIIKSILMLTNLLNCILIKLKKIRLICLIEPNELKMKIDMIRYSEEFFIIYVKI